MLKEGFEFKLKIKPLTAIAMAIVIATIGFGVGRYDLWLNLPFFKYSSGGSETSPTPTPEEIWRSTAFIGTLKFSSATGKYFLATASAEAITLEVPKNINLEELIGKRIMASGEYNKPSRILKVADALDMKVLPKSPVAVPTNSPTPSLIPSPPSATDSSQIN